MANVETQSVTVNEIKCVGPANGVVWHRMKITPSVFDAYLKCPTKCWLRATGESTDENPYAVWVKTRNAEYREIETARLVAAIPSDGLSLTPHIENAKTASWRMAVNLAARTNMESDIVESEIHMVERVPATGRGKAAQFIPIRFIFTNKLGKDDKLLLAFDTAVLSKELKRDIPLGKIIHGDDHATLKVKTSTLAGEVRKRLGTISTLISNPTPPDLVLNRHCAECEFQIRCRKIAVEQDDLSLLAGMSAKERQKLRSKGIFTVTQLSYTFRPRRRPKRLRDKREKYHHPLKALAIREKKIHIVGNPKLKIEGTPVYLDVEGLPDRDFYYLIGLRIGNGDSAVQHSLWADTVADEGKIWREFLAILETLEKPVLIHYGSYETTFLKRMNERWHELPESNALPRAIHDAINLVSVIFAQIYFPSFSNGLKELAGHLGFRWSNTAASGIQTITWREEWVDSRIPSAKRALLKYNAEDCEALELVAHKVIELHQHCPDADCKRLDEVVDTALLKREHPYHFKRNTFAFPELDTINNAAYWNYQRERVYLKTCTNLKQALVRTPKAKTVFAPNSTIECLQPRACPRCASTKFCKHANYSKTLFDLKFIRHGLRKWITRYRFHRYRCQSCGLIFQPEETCWGKGKFGPEIMSYSLYLNIELRIPQIHVGSMLNRLFGFDMDLTNIGRFKSAAAHNYKDTYNCLINRLCSGRLLHVDETKAKVRNKDGFVWVFANMKEVAYVYTETREGNLLQTMLQNFNGVLVSDFYAVYDSIQCPQQKCLIHLIRDLNEDVLKHPYDEELKQLAFAFSVLVKPMIETVERFGLKSRFLKKHLITVDRFYRQIDRLILGSEIAIRFKDRLQKNRDKLFTFLRFNGVPWNNNNAEHAVKPFAALRQIIGGITTEKGISDYLILLSVCQTCKYTGVDFLDFLRSGEKDIHTFSESQGGRRRIRE